MPNPKLKLGKGTKEKVSNAMLKERRTTAGKSPSTYGVGTYKNTGFDAPAPRTGGKAQKSIGVPTGTASKAPLKKAIKNVRKNAASKAAKQSAKKLYR